MEPKQPPRVLVIRGGAIGDFILTLPAIRLIRASIPDCHLEVVGYPGIADLAVKAGLAEGVRNFEHRTMAPLFAIGAAIDEELAAYLCSFNVVVSYLYDPDGHFRMSLQRVGVKTLIECPHQVAPGQGHAAEQLARPLAALAMFLEPEQLRAPFFKREGQNSPMRRIALHVGSGSTSKNWPLGNWREVAGAITESENMELALITGEAEAERGMTAEMRRDWASLPHRLWDSLPLPELADRLGTCDGFLGHDSGISHLAAGCGLPCVLLFGPTDPTVWAPPQPGVRVLRAPGGDLGQIRPEDVMAALRDLGLE